MFTFEFFFFRERKYVYTLSGHLITFFARLVIYIVQFHSLFRCRKNSKHLYDHLGYVCRALEIDHTFNNTYILTLRV